MPTEALGRTADETWRSDDRPGDLFGSQPLGC